MSCSELSFGEFGWKITRVNDCVAWYRNLSKPSTIRKNPAVSDKTQKELERQTRLHNQKIRQFEEKLNHNSFSCLHFAIICAQPTEMIITMSFRMPSAIIPPRSWIVMIWRASWNRKTLNSPTRRKNGRRNKNVRTNLQREPSNTVWKMFRSRDGLLAITPDQEKSLIDWLRQIIHTVQ